MEQVMVAQFRISMFWKEFVWNDPTEDENT
jgi:hypothetical protein